MLILVLAAVASAQEAYGAQQAMPSITNMLTQESTAATVTYPPGVQPPPVKQRIWSAAQPAAPPPAAALPTAAPYAASAPTGLAAALGGASPVAPASAGTFTSNAGPPMNGGNPMAAMLSMVTSAASGGSMATQPQGMGVQHFNHPYTGAALSQEASAVVSGLVEKFMHKAHLAPGEKACLETHIGEFAGDVIGTIGDMATGIKALIAGNGQVQKRDSGGLVSAGIDSAMKITSLVTVSTSFVKQCVNQTNGDALALLMKVQAHLTNTTYLRHRFIVNGVDIAHELSDCVVAFEAKDFHRFGQDIGLALRKLLLSPATNATRLPEGVPEEVIIQKATEGLMKGFFVHGSSVEITDAVHPDIDVVISLHQCVVENSQFFGELWMAAWDLIAKVSLHADAHGLGQAGQELQSQQAGGQPKWAGELMIAMMQFPMALSKCGVNQEMQSTFMEAIQSLNSIRVQFHMPSAGTGQYGVAQQGQEVSDKMAKAVEAWTEWNFEKFGYELGELFRDLVMLAFPQKYTVDATGRLRRYSAMAGPARSTSSSLVIMGGAAMTLLVAFAVVRTRRSVSRALAEPTLLVEPYLLEDGVADQSVE